MSGIDMHIHTTASDGLFTVPQIVEKAKVMGLNGIAITDHDTINGLREINKVSEAEDFLILPGIEISTIWEGKSVHLLGYLFDWQNTALQQWLAVRLTERIERAKEIIIHLRDIGVDLEEEEILAQQNIGSLGRVHIGLAMIKKGYASSLDEVFQKWLGEKGRVSIPPHRVSPKDAIEILHQAGGVSVVAHPGLSQCEQWLELFASWGLDGIEVYHPEHKKKQQKKYRQLAEKLGLFITGGSDFHSQGLGRCTLPQEYLAPIFCKTECYGGVCYKN